MGPTRRTKVATTSSKTAKKPARSRKSSDDNQIQNRENVERPTMNGAGTGVENNPLEKEIATIKAALAKEQAVNAELQKRLEDRTEKPASILIARPNGTAGTNFSIQEEMGLSGSVKKYETYKALQRTLRDLTLNAHINWEVPWANVPVRDKARLFEVARDHHPFLARFERDWATEEIIKQYVKNKRKNHYTHGWLEVPEKYAYLKEISSQRNPSGSRSKKAMTRALDATEIDQAAGLGDNP